MRFQRLVEPGVFNGDASLIRETHGELDSILIKVIAAFVVDVEGPKHARPYPYRQTHEGPGPLRLDPGSMFGEGPHIGRCICGDDGFATCSHAPADGCPDWYALPAHGLESPRG